MRKIFGKTTMMVTAAMLTAIATVLMYLDFPVPFLPAFYKIDFSELPVMIGSFMMGPVVGVVIEALKIVLKTFLKGTTSLGIGELANFIVGCAFLLPASIIYRVKKTKKRAIIGLIVGTVVSTVIGCLVNAFLLLPLYAKTMGMEAIIGLGTKSNGLIRDLPTFILFATAPLNLIKCTAVSLITAFIYKPLSRFISAGEDSNLHR